MKKLRYSGILFITLLFLAAGFTSCGQSKENVLPENTLMLTDIEITSLQFMHEEEKLARDVYTYFNQKYNLTIFNNISSSEQKHMDAVRTIMEKYGVANIASTEIGVFTNPDLQTLYNNLIAQGDVSLVSALTVGATIEDVDIRDLTAAVAATDKADIANVYAMLTCGSRNHMRAFTSNLNSRGEPYTPQYITVDDYNTIINGSHEMCGM